MISLHGLVAIVSQEVKEYKFKNDSVQFKLQVNSEIGYGDKRRMHPFQMQITVSAKDVEEARSKLTYGRVIEIVKGTLDPLPSNMPPKEYNVVNINTNWWDIRVCNTNTYYENIDPLKGKPNG